MMDRAGIKRYEAKKRLRHMEDFCQITEHMTENKYRGSMELVAKNLRRYSAAPGYDLSILLDTAVFIFLTGNSDMHLKNFSLIYDGGERRLAPAYDLLSTRLVIPAKDDPEEFAMPMNGKKSNFKEADFLKFTESAGLNEKHYKRAASSGDVRPCRPVYHALALPLAASFIHRHSGQRSAIVATA